MRKRSLPEPLRTSALVGRRQPYGWTWMASIGLHGLVVLGIVVASLYQPAPPDLNQKPIAAKLVRLGQPRPDHLLPRKPTAPPVPPVAKDAPVVTPGEKVAPLPPSPTPSPAKPESKPEPSKAATPTPSSSPATQAAAPKDVKPDPKASLDDIMKRFQKGAIAGPAEELPGQLDGDPEGDAAEASEGERYYALLEKRLRELYTLPSTISDQERLHLKATVLIHIEPNGRISQSKIIQSSGNSAFDSALEGAVKRASPFPPPPGHLASSLRRDGIAVNFRP